MFSLGGSAFMSGLARFVVIVLIFIGETKLNPVLASEDTQDLVDSLLKQSHQSVIRPRPHSSENIPKHPEQEQRRKKIWTPLAKNYTAEGEEISAVSDHSQLPKILRFSTEDQNCPVIYRDRQTNKKTATYCDPIYYHVYCSKNIYKQRSAPKGVVFHVYGGKHYIEKQDPTHTSRETMLARDGYIVYCINARGVDSLGIRFKTLQGRSGGLFSTIDDINYFAYLLRHKKLDTYNNSPHLSPLVTDYLPFILLGSSMGGHVTLLIATAEKHNLHVPHFKKLISTDNLFDAYISLMPIVDVHNDVTSDSYGGRSRLTYFNSSAWKENGFTSWMKNAYTSYNPFLLEADNERFSPIYRAHNLHAPTFLFHGLLDSNVSPQESIAFGEACRRAGTDIWTSVCFDPGGKHRIPSEFAETYNFYEAVFQFLDHVTKARRNNKRYMLTDLERAATYSSIRLAHHLIYAKTELYKVQAAKFTFNAAESFFTYSATTTDPKKAWRNYSLGFALLYYGAIIELHIHKTHRISGLRGNELLSVKAERLKKLNVTLKTFRKKFENPSRKRIKTELKFVLDHPIKTSQQISKTNALFEPSWADVVKTEPLLEFKEKAPIFYDLFGWLHNDDRYKGYQRFIALNKILFDNFIEIIRIKKELQNK